MTNNSFSITDITEYKARQTKASSDRSILPDIGTDSTQKAMIALAANLIKVKNDHVQINHESERTEQLADSTAYHGALLIPKLPLQLPLPTIDVDNDGYLEFEWYQDGRSCSIYVTDTKTVHYVAVFSKQSVSRGTFSIEEPLGETVLSSISNVFTSSPQQMRFTN